MAQKHVKVFKIALITFIYDYYTTKKVNLAIQRPNKPFKGQNVPWRPLFLKILKKSLKQSWKVMKMWLKPFYVTFVYLSIFWPSGHNLAFKKFVRTLDSQIDLFGSIIIMYEWYETNFEFFDVLLCDLAFLAKGVAFLALTTLKLQNTEIK